MQFHAMFLIWGVAGTALGLNELAQGTFSPAGALAFVLGILGLAGFTCCCCADQGEEEKVKALLEHDPVRLPA